MALWFLSLSGGLSKDGHPTRVTWNIRGNMGPRPMCRALRCKGRYLCVVGHDAKQPRSVLGCRERCKNGAVTGLGSWTRRFWRWGFFVSFLQHFPATAAKLGLGMLQCSIRDIMLETCLGVSTRLMECLGAQKIIMLRVQFIAFRISHSILTLYSSILYCRPVIPSSLWRG